MVAELCDQNIGYFVSKIEYYNVFWNVVNFDLFSMESLWVTTGSKLIGKSFR
jgi:hypothetical protein